MHQGAVFVAHATLRGDSGEEKRRTAASVSKDMAAAFKAASEREADTSLACLVVTLDGIGSHEYRYVLDGAYAEVKGTILAMKLMFGAFHPYQNRPSAYNPHFFPMRSPIPVLAFRHMTRVDWKSLSEKPEYLAAFTRFFGEPPTQ